MESTYLIFSHCGARYALDVRAVREIVWLPDLSPIEELPPYIAGVFNLRGQVVPVMDLGLRFGHASEPYCPNDRVILIAGDRGTVGVVVNALHNVLPISPAEIDDARSYQGAGGRARFVTGEARLEGRLAMLLDVPALLQCGQPGEIRSGDLPQVPLEARQQLFGRLSPEDTQLLRERARSLAEVHQTDQRAGLEAYAVFRLNEELFALALEAVREFSHLRGVTPIPCCPPHIAGNINLRGDILTLVDLRPALGKTMQETMHEVLVVRAEELRFGIPASEIVDVLQFAPTDIVAVPAASDHAGKHYCKGVAALEGQAVSILDLNAILAARMLQVNEVVQ